MKNEGKTLCKVVITTFFVCMGFIGEEGFRWSRGGYEDFFYTRDWGKIIGITVASWAVTSIYLSSLKTRAAKPAPDNPR